MNSVHKRLKIGPEFLPTLSILFRPQTIAHPLSGINAAPHGVSKRNGIGLVCSSDSNPPKDFSLTTASHWAALSGNATF